MSYGNAGYTPIVGDWNGDGIDTLGVFVNGLWYLRNSNTPGPPDIAVSYGTAGYRPITGRWGNSGPTGIGVIVPT